MRLPAFAFAGYILALTTALLSRAAAQEVKPPEPPPEFNPATEPAVVAVAKVLPAVVNISTERIVRQSVQDPFELFYEQFFNEPSNRRPRELEQKIQSLGSGFLIDAEGDIVTNEHVVQRAADLKIQVTFSDGTNAPAKYIAGDAQADLALIKIESREKGRPYPFINLKTVSPNLLGETVLVLGNPLGYNSSVARGILSANEREITIENTVYKHLLQTDAAINPGNSGGPLIDLAGRLVGISSVKLAFTPQGTPTQGLGFAIPAAVVAARVAEFKEAGRNGTPSTGTADQASRRLFGMQLQALTGPLAHALGARNVPGVLISDVEHGSAAENAGLRRGMIIYQVGTYAASSPAQVETLLKDVTPGMAVDFVIGLSKAAQNWARGGEQIGTVTLIARG